MRKLKREPMIVRNNTAWEASCCSIPANIQCPENSSAFNHLIGLFAGHRGCCLYYLSFAVTRVNNWFDSREEEEETSRRRRRSLLKLSKNKVCCVTRSNWNMYERSENVPGLVYRWRNRGEKWPWELEIRAMKCFESSTIFSLFSIVY